MWFTLALIQKNIHIDVVSNSFVILHLGSERCVFPNSDFLNLAEPCRYRLKNELRMRRQMFSVETIN